MTIWQALIILGITTLIGALGWLINKILSVYRELTESINKLNVTIAGINGVLLSIQDGNQKFERGCDNRHEVVDTRLNAHSEKINLHGEQIAALKTVMQ